MAQVELSGVQREILATLLDTHRRTESPVTRETLADELDRTPGSLVHKLQTLKALDLIEGIPGPKGGYRPTVEAQGVLDVQNLDQPASIPMARNYDRVTTTVEAIDFTDVDHPDQSRARLRFRQPVERFTSGDAILVGPTPVADLVVGGEVLSTDESRNEVLVDVAHVEAPFDEA